MKLTELPTPCVVCEQSVLEWNIREMATLASDCGKRLRPHVKTHKCVEIASLQRQAGAVGITVAKIGEAEVFANAGFRDIFVANLIVSPQALRRAARLARLVQLTMGVDSLDTAALLCSMAAEHDVNVRVLIEVDTGHGRAGVRSPEDAARIARRLRMRGDVRLEGVYTHEGHAYRCPPDRVKELCNTVVQKLAACRSAAAEAYGEPLPVMSVGSTPSAVAMAHASGVTELRPGNYVFHDATQVRLGAAETDCALSVLTTVVARPSSTEALLDAGVKALAGDRDPVYGHGFVLGHANTRIDWASEEHGHLHLGMSALRPRVGDRVRIVPAHACTCVNMHPWLWLVDGEDVVGRLPVSARDCLA